MTRLIYVAIDDTDVVGSRGTGYLARTLADALAAAGAEARGITRHQLLVDERIPYTSHNSSACIALGSDRAVDDIAAAAGEHLARHAADGSDPGLCVAAAADVPAAVTAFGERAKREIVDEREARELARGGRIVLSAHGGTGLGVIGALAAAGLRAGGDDGRFLELGGIRALAGRVSVAALHAAGVGAFAMGDALIDLGDAATVDVGDWCRPVLRAGVATLLVEEGSSAGSGWRAVGRDHIRIRY